MTSNNFNEALTVELRSFSAACEEVLSLVSRENQAMTSAEYRSADFFHKKKNLLPRLEKFATNLRNLRIIWQQTIADERISSEEVKSLFSKIQQLVMKVVLLNRQNQELLLQRGLLPISHLQSVTKPNNYVARLYRRHSA